MPWQDLAKCNISYLWVLIIIIAAEIEELEYIISNLESTLANKNKRSRRVKKRRLHETATSNTEKKFALTSGTTDLTRANIV